jgi:uncharacterized cupin superfamily protein
LMPGPTSAEADEALRHVSATPPPLGYVASIRRIPPMAERSNYASHDAMDAVFVMDGSVTLLLDGGDDIDLRPGDVLIQNGTPHAWHNRESLPALLGVVSIGGVRLPQ